jgi:hypothetical protein
MSRVLHLKRLLSKVILSDCSTSVETYFSIYLTFLGGRKGVLEFELLPSGLSGRHSTTQAKPPALFCFSYFSHRVLSFCTGLASDIDLHIYAFHIAGITDTCHYAGFIGFVVGSN